MSAQLLSAVKELMDLFDHTLLHRDTSVCVRMSKEDWIRFQATASAEGGTALSESSKEAAAGANVTTIPGGGGDVHVQFQAGDFHAMSEAHKEESDAGRVQQAAEETTGSSKSDAGLGAGEGRSDSGSDEKRDAGVATGSENPGEHEVSAGTQEGGASA